MGFKQGIAGSRHGSGFRLSIALLVAIALIGVAAPASASPTRIGGSTIVRVAGQSISRTTVVHWMFVAARSQAMQTPGQPAIVPLDPPGFARCIRTTRRKVPSLSHSPRRTLRGDCRALFKALSGEVLDYLITVHWYIDLARVENITITHEQVLKAYRKVRREQFPTWRDFRHFLKQTGQTVSDILFRFRANLVFLALLRRTHLSMAKADSRVLREAQKRYRHQTMCARYWVMLDCANFRPTSHRH